MLKQKKNIAPCFYSQCNVCLFVDTREHCDVSLSSEPFNSRHIPGLTQVNIDCTFIIVLIVESTSLIKKRNGFPFILIFLKSSQTIF